MATNGGALVIGVSSLFLTPICRWLPDSPQSFSSTTVYSVLHLILYQPVEPTIDLLHFTRFYLGYTGIRIPDRGIGIVEPSCLDLTDAIERSQQIWVDREVGGNVTTRLYLCFGYQRDQDGIPCALTTAYVSDFGLVFPSTRWRVAPIIFEAYRKHCNQESQKIEAAST